MDDSPILIGLVRCLGYAALVALGYAWVVTRFKWPVARGAAVGLLFGTAGLLSMADPIRVAPGVIVDARVPVLVLAASYGGVIGGLVSGTMLAVARVLVGGVGMISGVTGIILAVLIGIGFSRLPRHMFSSSWLRQILLGAVGWTSVLTVLLLPRETALEVLREALGPLFVADVVGVVVLSRFIDREKERIRVARMLKRAASVDPLTNLANRRQFDQQAESVFGSAELRGRPAAMVMIDIDHFKRINDSWGHQAGDAVLSAIADIVKGCLRSSDVVARFGGEEIAILMPNTTLATAEAIAERVRQRIARNDFSQIAPALHVTLSAGVADTDIGRSDVTSLIKVADDALYRAKSAGRNRVVAMAA